MKYFVHFFSAATLLFLSLASSATEPPERCPLCKQRTIAEIVYGQPNLEMAERQLYGELIILDFEPGLVPERTP